LREALVRHAVVDLDALAWCFPRPSHDPFYQALALRNLAFVWENYRQEGAERLVIARVIESRDELAGYQAAVPGATITIVRLRASPETLGARLDRRGIGISKARNLRRSSNWPSCWSGLASRTTSSRRMGEPSTRSPAPSWPPLAGKHW